MTAASGPLPIGGAFIRIARRSLRLSAASLVIAALAIPARAHQHVSPGRPPVAWYPADCCHNQDCHPVAEVVVVEGGIVLSTEDGWRLFVSRNAHRRPSLDDRWHVCFGAQEVPQIFCIFEAPGS